MKLSPKTSDRFRTRFSSIASRLADHLSPLRPYLPPINFITLHYAYFIFLSLFLSLIFYAAHSPTPSKSSNEDIARRRISYLDALFHTVSSLTGTGLNTVPLCDMSVGQQVVLFLAMLAGHPVLVSLGAVWFRKDVFEKKFREIVQRERERKEKMEGGRLGKALVRRVTFNLALTLTRERSRDGDGDRGGLAGLGTRIKERREGERMSPTPTPNSSSNQTRERDRDRERDLEPGLPPIHEQQDPNPNTSSLLSPQPQFLFPSPPSHSPASRSIQFIEPPRPDRPSPSLSPSPDPNNNNNNNESGNDTPDFIARLRHSHTRNASFANLTLSERQYLGGVEYRALEVLIVTVTAYFILWPLFGAIALGAWLSRHGGQVSEQETGEKSPSPNPWWEGIFLSVSAFGNGGMVLGPEMGSFLDRGVGGVFVLLVVSLLTLAGSQASPVFLRVIFLGLWGILKRVVADEGGYAVWRETFEFILRYPRRVYINMFAARDTWRLAGWLAAFLAVDWVLFWLLNIGNGEVEGMPRGKRVLGGLAQSISNLSGGFAIIPVSAVSFSLQVFWLIKIYASAYPTSITVRGSNVYEERSLGIYMGDEPPDSDDSGSDNEKRPAKAKPLPESEPEPEGTTTGLMIPSLPRPPLTPVSTTSQVSRLSTASRRGLTKLVGITRQGTAFMGRQIQRRMTTGFQGVGVSASAALPIPQKSTLPTFNTPATSTSSKTTTAPTPAPKPDLTTHHARSQLSHDIPLLALSFLLLVLIETPHISSSPLIYSLWNILFELVSAYANNGITVGFPGRDYSFCGGWRKLSKLLLVGVMLRGRHRDLPVALDRAVKLPREGDWDGEEEEDGEIRKIISRSPAVGRSPMLGRLNGL